MAPQKLSGREDGSRFMRKHKALPPQPIEDIVGLFDEAPKLLLQLERFLRFKKSLAGFCERVIGYGNQEFFFFNNQRVPFSDARKRFEVLCTINQQQEKTIGRIYSLTNYLLGSLPYDSKNQETSTLSCKRGVLPTLEVLRSYGK
ncbi:hypothetical protein HYU14_02150 [Candidatus Woesearchaeota archaeon]|nr:hypothetical protein [Candidatus Woesearchaeota archaeon]